MVSDDFVARASLLGTTAAAFRLRFQRRGDPEDLEKALSKWTRSPSAAAAPHDCSDKGAILISLAAALESSFDRTHNLADLDEAISREEKPSLLRLTMNQIGHVG